ncbi:hypothetical protein EIP73_05100 [Xylella fastidiosa subsp. pauca]|nr:hypothetical protein EIP73_05100 [Xylella fastidiosa subsp. pauca]
MRSSRAFYARNAVALRLWKYSPPLSREARTGRFGFPALQHHGRPRERFISQLFQGRQPHSGKTGEAHGTCSARALKCPAMAR